ncbi:hypothetical protein D3C81_1378860 [compost metagenome]
MGGCGAGQQFLGQRFCALGHLPFGSFDAPGFGRDAAEGDPAAAVLLDHGRHRHQGEGVGRAVANLLVEVSATKGRRQRDGGDQLMGRQAGFDVGRGAGQSVQVGDGNDTGATVGFHRLDLGIEQAHGHGHVAGMSGDAGAADADDAQLPTHAVDGRATAAGLAFVAGLVGVVEIRATGALQQVAGGARHVAQLAGCAGEQGPGQHCVVFAHAHVGGEVGISDQGANAQTTVIGGFDPVQACPVDVDQVGGGLDLELHQVEQVGAACNEARTVDLGGEGGGIGG